MHKSQRFGQILIQPQNISNGAGNLCNFDRMREAVPEVIGDCGGEDLRFVFQAAESARMDDAVAIALKGVAVRMPGFGISAPARGLNGKPEMTQHSSGCYFCGRSFIASMAIWLTSDFSAASCRKSFLASSGFVGAITFA